MPSSTTVKASYSCRIGLASNLAARSSSRRLTSQRSLAELPKLGTVDRSLFPNSTLRRVKPVRVGVWANSTMVVVSLAQGFYQEMNRQMRFRRLSGWRGSGAIRAPILIRIVRHQLSRCGGTRIDSRIKLIHPPILFLGKSLYLFVCLYLEFRQKYCSERREQKHD